MNERSLPLQQDDDVRDDVLQELLAREPIFHHPEFGTQREDYERMMAPEFREVGASGTRYDREFILNVLAERAAHPQEERWEVREPQCQKIGENIYLMTYTLLQGERVTRRSTIWRNERGEWRIVYHQGTIVQQEGR